MREYAVRRGWQIAAEINEVGSGALQRPKSIGRSLTAHNTKWPILYRIVAIPQRALLRSVPGVGPLTALTYLLTVADTALRFQS